MLLVYDGSAYLGDWFNDNYHGQGIYIHPDGERYDGELEHGEKTGMGKMYYINGDYYEG